MAYYYLISSLPMLRADDDIPISYDDFLKMCHGNLNDDLYNRLKSLSLDTNEGAFLSKWAEFYKSFKEELSYQRKQRLGVKAQLPNQRDSSISKIIASAMNNKNPLEAEKILLSFQFQKLDELIGVHYFDNSALIGYALKLKLLERKNSFKQELGKNEFNRIINKLENQIMNMEQE